MSRPDNIKHYTEIQDEDNSHYPQSDEILSIASSFGRHMGLTRLGIHHELVPPGRRTSWPHAESDIDEFVYVIEGNPDVWLDGTLHRLSPGDGVAFPYGTGEAHTFLNNTESDVRLLVVGEKSATRPKNRLVYPVNSIRKEQLGDSYWHDAPERPLGDHDGLPDKQKS
ncbi:MAG: cupin domain-containing protein [Chloroflexota bacterium]